MLEYIQEIDIEATNYGVILSNGDAKYQKRQSFGADNEWLFFYVIKLE